MTWEEAAAKLETACGYDFVTKIERYIQVPGGKDYFTISIHSAGKMSRTFDVHKSTLGDAVHTAVDWITNNRIAPNRGQQGSW